MAGSTVATRGGAPMRLAMAATLSMEAARTPTVPAAYAYPAYSGYGYQGYGPVLTRTALRVHQLWLSRRIQSLQPSL